MPCRRFAKAGADPAIVLASSTVIQPATRRAVIVLCASEGSVTVSPGAASRAASARGGIAG